MAGHEDEGLSTGPAEAAPEELSDADAEGVDLLETVRARAAEDPSPPDRSLGGYMREHDRPSAFEGADGQPYTVDVDVEAVEGGPPGRAYAAFLIFVRWAETGAGILEHVESHDIAYGPTPEAAREAALELSLYEVKAELDRAIERRREELES
jgi:hypothetical protein